VARLAESRQLSTFAPRQKSDRAIWSHVVDLMMVRGLQAAFDGYYRSAHHLEFANCCGMSEERSRIATIERSCSLMVIHGNEPRAYCNLLFTDFESKH
jgi:hypothetical protein